MLSDEEKAVLKTAKENYGLTSAEQKILVNLIEKQSKEIEELKEDKYGLEEEVQMQAKNIMLCENALCEIQDKIKAKIEEVDYKMIAHQDVREAVKQVLQSLLEKE